ncbi:hypothetical protein R2601_04448 [Salipiger bermudensis HTCC2601]|uniref:Uncharacterized protein n=1 Tax=Salipiger bermudensis (strain DSM 26914 / JCM 13377 / KCTC 12554 / HTCC2601) TaxID=314265 RepID=Q0FVV6_SALBH|nr:hypothetical protein R2601_04448 [Salipiger bermudensis HTCC2601]
MCRPRCRRRHCHRLRRRTGSPCPRRLRACRRRRRR